MIETRTARVGLGLVLLAAVLYLPRLGASALWDPWEPRYAQAAREMAAAHQWLVPHYREDPRLNRPPLTYWLIGAAQAALGVSELSARLPSALLAGLAAVALGAALAARGRPLEGFLAGAALLTTPQWLLVGRFATPAAPLSAFLALALALALVRPLAQSPRGSRALFAGVVLLVAAAGLTDWPRGLLLPLWAVLGWACLGWSFKGPLALAIVGAVYHVAQLTYSVRLNLAAIALAFLASALVLHRRAGVTVRALVAGLVLLTLLVAPWFLHVLREQPGELSLFRYKYAFNLGESEHRHVGPYGYVLRVVAVGAMPWSAAAAAGLALALRRRRDELARLAAGAGLGGLLFFTLSEAKMAYSYVVLQPAIAVLAGIGVVHLARRIDWVLAIAAGAFLAVARLAWTDPEQILETATVKWNLQGVDVTAAVAAVLGAWLLALLAAHLRGRESWAVATVLPAAFFAGMWGMSVVPRLAPYKSAGPMWQTYLARRGGDEPIGLVGEPSLDSAFYYSDNAIVRPDKPEELERFLGGPGVKFLIGTQEGIEPAVHGFPGRWDFLERKHPTHRLLRYDPAGL